MPAARMMKASEAISDLVICVVPSDLSCRFVVPIFRR